MSSRRPSHQARGGQSQCCRVSPANEKGDQARCKTCNSSKTRAERITFAGHCLLADAEGHTTGLARPGSKGDSLGGRSGDVLQFVIAKSRWLDFPQINKTSASSNRGFAHQCRRRCRCKDKLILTNSVVGILDKQAAHRGRTERGIYRLRTLESFCSHFFAYRCRFVERGCFDKRAGQRYSVSQP